ncbi:hypothetical protein ACFV98_29020 [Streptomyces violascens]|uniref:hypothetical protein n=1 Tax=Streptomyces violascens TaxID=67381 RepID=UPI0036510EB0
MTWHSEYDGKTLTASGQVDIDHMVPAETAISWECTRSLAKAFRLAVSHRSAPGHHPASNRSKGHQTPDLWKPPLKSHWRTYSRAWIDVKHVYELNIAEAEKTALGDMLDTCDS